MDAHACDAPACRAERPPRKDRVERTDRLPYVRTAASNSPIGPGCKVHGREAAPARHASSRRGDEQLTAPAQRIVRCRIDHTAAGEGGIELRAPQGQLEAWKVSDVAGVIAEAEAAARRGWYAAGFVAYEAAPAFDAAFRTKSVAAPGEMIPHLPLAWFGLFAESEDVAPLHSCATGTEPTPRPLSVENLRSGAARSTNRYMPAAFVPSEQPLRTERPTSSITPLASVGHGPTTEDPFCLYRQLVTGHNGGYHAYIETTDWAIACGSPELFFDFSSGRLTARPMKGTAPRGRSAAEDAEQAAALSTSAKERAENIMVVDLLRNDMGRIAETGSVAVPQLWRVERHPSVWQLTSTVTARTPRRDRTRRRLRGPVPLRLGNRRPQDLGDGHRRRARARPSRRLLRRGRVDSP